jgi:SAM-dependent methyltransferase
VGADVSVGVSGGQVAEADVARMAKGRIIFALANPDPEIHPAVAAKYATVVATGRSDFPNQIDNVLAFPGISRGVLESSAPQITEPMKLAAAEAIANLVRQPTAEEIVPSVFEGGVAEAVSRAARGERSTTPLPAAAMLPAVSTEILGQVRNTLRSRMRHGKTPSGVPLPPLAYRMGGRHFHDDSDFIRSATLEADRLVKFTGLNATSRLLDWGCGAGRLAIGISERFGRIGLYHGVDIQQPLIQWAAHNLGRRDGYRFTHSDISNARYNPTGKANQAIPAESDGYDVFYAYSVFSHLTGVDVQGYLREAARVLRPGGAAFVTAFVEDGVSPEEENPQDYGPLVWKGPLHCVRFSSSRFSDLVSSAGLAVEQSRHGQETDGQSLFILSKG